MLWYTDELPEEEEEYIDITADEGTVGGMVSPVSTDADGASNGVGWDGRTGIEGSWPCSTGG